MILYLIVIILIFYFINKIILTEHFNITTWTPYIVDYNNQPGYSNYFYNNGYMYPIY